uniref:Uncharacterized protein n=1 Tax=Cannabis sativa TaxID=3483 RepID=A0A803QRZ9_CANSA
MAYSLGVLILVVGLSWVRSLCPKFVSVDRDLMGSRFSRPQVGVPSGIQVWVWVISRSKSRSKDFNLRSQVLSPESEVKVWVPDAGPRSNARLSSIYS